MAKNTTTAWASFPTRAEVDEAVQRLVSGGFARNSIDLDRQQDGTWHVVVHTREHNLQRVEGLLRSPSPMYAAYTGLSGPVQSLMNNRAVVLGAAALAGLVFYTLLHGQRRPTLQGIRRFPRRVWDTAQALPETVHDTARAIQETVTELPSTVRDVASTFTSRDGQPPSGGDAGTKPR
jgi:hypothetical protein